MSERGQLQGGQWLNDLFEQELARRSGEHQLRQRIPITPIDAVHVEIDGKRYVNFASNDYLGLTHHSAAADSCTFRTGTLAGGIGRCCSRSLITSQICRKRSAASAERADRRE